MTNYAVNSWSVDGTVVQTGGTTFTLNNITADHTVKVTFSYTGPTQGDWWMFHHDPQHTGRSPFTGPASPVQKWAFPPAVSYRLLLPGHRGGRHHLRWVDG